MKTNPNAKRKYIVSRCEGLRLSYHPNHDRWTMTGGKHGIHSLYAPNIYNNRVAFHWEGYIKNNDADPIKMTFKDYELDK